MSGAAAVPMVRAEGLAKRFPRHAVLKGVDLRVERGERVAVLGLNGTGKTTLFRCLLGLTDFEGRLEVDGRSAGPQGVEARARVGYVPQRPPRFDLPLERFLEVFADLRGMETAPARAALEALGLDLDRHGAKPLGQLSGGMLQKAMLALAVAAEAPLLLLDEPTANLDAASRREFLAALSRVEPGTTLLFASHRLDDVEALADRILVLHDGRFAFDGSVERLTRRAGGRRCLWVRLRPEARAAAVAALAACPAVDGVRRLGVGVEVELEAHRVLDVLWELRRRGWEPEEFGTRPPDLEDVLERLLRGGAGDGRPAAGGAAAEAARREEA